VVFPSGSQPALGSRESVAPRDVLSGGPMAGAR
jgi:hypothetical protein